MRSLLVFLLLQLSSSTAPAINGTVVDAGTTYFQPLLGARVEFAGASVVRTDTDGRFAFSSIAAGRYRINVTAEGYIRKSTMVTVAAGQTNNIRISLDPAPIMAGHVRDTYNVPISNMLVEAIKVIYGPRGDRSVMTLASALTDDRGEYHLYWLDPGEYYIRATTLPAKTPRTPNPPPYNPDPQALVYAPTYYPGLRDPKEAAPIRLRAATNLGPFDFKMQPLLTVYIQGHIATDQGPGLPGVCGAKITLTPAGATASVQQFEGKSGCGSILGEFAISGMPPGTFLVTSNFVLEGQSFFLHRKLVLNGPDRAVILRLTQGTTVSGLIAPIPGVAMNFTSLRVTLDSADPDLPPPEIARVESDGSFVLKPVEPGAYVIRVLNLPGDTYLKSAQSGAADIRGKPLRVEYETPAPIRVEIAADGGWMEGSIVDSSNRPLSNAKVVLVPDAARRSFPDQYGVDESDSDGRFVIHGIPPGEYSLYAWENIEPNAYMNATVLGRYESLGAPVTIAPSSGTSVTLRAIPAE